MIKDVAFGQYYPTQSFVHRLDPPFENRLSHCLYRSYIFGEKFLRACRMCRRVATCDHFFGSSVSAGIPFGARDFVSRAVHVGIEYLFLCRRNGIRSMGNLPYHAGGLDIQRLSCDSNFSARHVFVAVNVYDDARIAHRRIGELAFSF